MAVDTTPTKSDFESFLRHYDESFPLGYMQEVADMTPSDLVSRFPTLYARRMEDEQTHLRKLPELRAWAWLQEQTGYHRAAKRFLRSGAAKRVPENSPEKAMTPFEVGQMVLQYTLDGITDTEVTSSDYCREKYGSIDQYRASKLRDRLTDRSIPRTWTLDVLDSIYRALHVYEEQQAAKNAMLPLMDRVTKANRALLDEVNRFAVRDLFHRAYGAYPKSVESSIKEMLRARDILVQSSPDRNNSRESQRRFIKRMCNVNIRWHPKRHMLPGAISDLLTMPVFHNPYDDRNVKRICAEAKRERAEREQRSRNP
jgi:hypothetical protein